MVRRYFPSIAYGRDGEYAFMEPDSFGDYVRHDDYAALEARLAELEKDAARYRWLRENCVEQAAEDDAGPYLYHGVPWNCNWRRELDDAVDDAMSREA